MSARNALYYPYIHIHDVNWLKATLLLFGQVRRMMPRYFSEQNDAAAVREFVSKGKHLVSIANLTAPRVVKAQDALAGDIERDAVNPDFVATYDRAATRRALPRDSPGFQIHRDKLLDSLLERLVRLRLAWDPVSPEPYDFRGEYIELHPRLGEAVMSTLAIACALHEGLDIVGDRRSGELHSVLLKKQQDAVYRAWLHPEPALAEPKAATAEALFEVLVGVACDLEKLTPERLANIRKDREPLEKLLSRLRKHAAGIPKMDPGRERDQFVKDEVASILKHWERDRANMSAFWRTFFGKGLVDTSAKFLEKVGNETVAGITAGGATAAVGGAAIAHIATGAMIGGAAGLAVGLAVHTGASVNVVRKRERDSHYRYLTIMQDQGVVFRTDVAGFAK